MNIKFTHEIVLSHDPYSEIINGFLYISRKLSIPYPLVGVSAGKDIADVFYRRIGYEWDGMYLGKYENMWNVFRSERLPDNEAIVGDWSNLGMLRIKSKIKIVNERV